MRKTLTEAELNELGSYFSDLINYESEDPEDPINPITYRDSGGDTCLHFAVLRENLRAMQLLIKAGIDVNVKGDMERTPLQYALHKGNKEIIDFLIQNGASN